MNQRTTLNPALIGFKFWAAIFLFFAGCHIFVYYNGFNEKEWNTLFAFIYAAIDTLLITYSWNAFRNRRDKVAKNFYLILFISLIPAIFTHELYNIIYHVVGVKETPKELGVYWAAIYALSLSLHCIIWLYLILANKNKQATHNGRLVKLAYIQSAVIFIISLVFINTFRSSITNQMGLFVGINAVLEIIAFLLISICLSRTENKSLIYIEMGFLLTIAFNLSYRFSGISRQNAELFHALWLLSQILIIYGFTLACKDKDKPIKFLEINSLQVLISAIFMIFFNIVFATFAVIVYLGVGENLVSIDVLAKNVPSALVVVYTLSLLVAKLLSEYISKPLEYISQKIDHIKDNVNPPINFLTNPINIYEVSRLDNFIVDTVSKLHAANRVKSDFLMNMSHDFRTPASGICYALRSIQRRVGEPKLSKMIQLAINSSDQLLQCFEDVLDYSRLDSAQYRVKLELLDIDTIINEIILLLSAKSKEKNIDLIFSATNRGIQYYGDKLMIHRIILNLVSNAVKFTDSGSVTISVELGQDYGTPLLVIKVMDTGIGIDKAHHQAIFEPFHRVESGETAAYSGIGLGLSNVNIMLKAIGGRILLESSLWAGATFTVFLPLEIVKQL